MGSELEMRDGAIVSTIQVPSITGLALSRPPAAHRHDAGKCHAQNRKGPGLWDRVRLEGDEQFGFFTRADFIFDADANVFIILVAPNLSHQYCLANNPPVYHRLNGLACLRQWQ